MDILLIEDDEFKAADLTRTLDDIFDDPNITRAASVTSALRIITAQRFGIVVLDMSLPTFDLSGPGGGGSPQGQGGIEVLRLAKRLGQRSVFIVVTQYPDIEVDGKEIPLEIAATKLSAKFSLDVRRCVAYEFNSDKWRNAFVECIDEIKMII